MPPPPIADEFRDTFEALHRHNVLVTDPPDHTRLRNLVNTAFTSRMVDSLRPRISAIADDLLGTMEAHGQVDLIRALAYPLPVTVIAEMLGVPPADRGVFKRWSDDLLVLTDPFGPIDGALQSALEMRRYLEAICTDRRRRPGDDLISALVAAEEQGETLSEQELFAMCLVLLVAGHETTTNLIGNAVLALLRHPDQRRRLQEDLSLMRTAVEEFLRYESVVQSTARVAMVDCAIGGKPIHQGDLVITVLGAANRDPEQFVQPDMLNLGRRDSHHVGFGYGIHFCVGAPLARLEAQIVLTAFLRRFPDFDGACDAPNWKPRLMLRGLESLPLWLG